MAKNKEIIVKILLVGKEGCGKTQFLNRYTKNQFSETYIATFGVDYGFKDENTKNKSYRFQIWDVSGQERFKATRNVYYRGTDVAIICYDSTQQIDLEHIKIYIQEINKDAKLPNFLVVATKCDKEQGVNRISDSQLRELQQELKETQQIFHLETNAKLGLGITEVFKKVTELADERLAGLSENEKEYNNEVLHSPLFSLSANSNNKLPKPTFLNRVNLFCIVYNRFINSHFFEGPRGDQLQEFGNIYIFLCENLTAENILSKLFQNQEQWKINRAHENPKHIYSWVVCSLREAQNTGQETIIMKDFTDFKKWIEKMKAELDESSYPVYQDQEKHQEVLAALTDPATVKKDLINRLGW